MATEKILNTRIQLKYDTLANWNNSTFILKKGEVAVVTVPTAEGSTLEPVMFKVGDGAKTFKQLDWASAKAADVYSWAKQSGISVVETAGANDGSYVTGLKWENNQLVPEVVAFDTTMSTTSTNAVQNKVIKKYVDDAVAGVVAGEVKNAEYATEAGHAATATKANHAVSADSATEAGKATNDGENRNIVATYATKAEIEAQEALWTKDTVTSVIGNSNAITAEQVATTGDPIYRVDLKLNTAGNVTLTQDKDGLKANTTPEAIGAQPAGKYKTTQTAVADKITKDNHVLTSLTQNANGVISYEVKELTPAAIGAQPAGNYKTKQGAITSPTANGNATEFIDTISQDTNGVITATKKSIDLSGYKTKQGEYTETLSGAQVLGTITQNANGEIDITARTLTAKDLGLDSAMHFIGVSATAPAKGPGNRELQSGDVYLNSANNTEYVWVDGKWNELGDEGTAGSHALKSTSITANNGLTSTAKLDGTGSIGIADNGVTTVKIKDGNVTKAKLASDVQTSLDLADSAVQSVVLTRGTDGNLETYKLIVDNDQTGGELASLNAVFDHVSDITGAIGDKTVKAYVDDAVAGVVAGNVAYAAKAGHATTADSATTAGHATTADSATAAGKATNDGNGKEISKTYKVKQTAVSDPTASGKSLTFIDSISQNTEGVITATKKNVNLDAYALKADLPEIPDVVITETKGALGTGGTIFVSGKLAADTVTGHTISQPMFGLTQQGDIEFVTDKQTIEADQATTKAVSFAIKDKAVTAEKTAAYTTENSDGTHTASTEVWVLYGGSATENI